MPERQTGKPEIAAQKRSLKLAPAVGDWTTYKPAQPLVKKVKTGLYGFDRLSREELDLVLRIHYHFIEALLKRLKIDLKMSVELFSVNLEQTTYLNFLRLLTSPIAQTKINIPELHDNVSFILDLSLANSIINYALGSYDLEPLNRGLTEAESATLATTLTEYLPLYSAAFENIFAAPSLAIVGSPDISLDSAINASATFLSCSAAISLGDNPPARILIGYPGPMLKKLLAIFKKQVRQKPLNFSRLGSVLLNKIIIAGKVALGHTYLSTREINQLEIGDVVPLDTAINSALPLEIGRLVKIPCQPGIQGKKYGARVAGGQNEEVEIEPPPVTAIEKPKPAVVTPPAPQPSPLPVPPAREAFLEEEDFTEDLSSEAHSAEEEDFADEDFTDEDFADDDEFADEELDSKET